jgi:cytochrome c553
MRRQGVIGATQWVRTLLGVVGLCAGLQVFAQAKDMGSEMAQRVKPCMACHGEQGRAGPDGYYPRLAGKPKGYLFHQLQNFAQDRRHYPLMRKLLEPLSPEYRQEMAAYFSSLTLPYPAPSKTLQDYPAEMMERGRTLALQGDAALELPACASCHGDQLMGAAPDVAGILGLPVVYLNAQLSAWRDGKRRSDAPDCMAKVVQQLSLDDAAAVSAWLSVQAVDGQHWKTNQTPLSVQWRCGSAPLLSHQGVK